MWITLCATGCFALAPIIMLFDSTGYWFMVFTIPGMCGLGAQGTVSAAYILRNYDFPHNPLDKKRMNLASGVANWLLNSETSTQTIFRPFLFALIAAAFSFSFVTGIHAFALHLKANNKLILWYVPIAVGLALLGLIYIRITAFVIVVVGLGAISFMMLLTALLFLVLELSLKCIRGFAWRIAEYNKGPFAAILLLFTALLGIAEVYLRFLKQ
jgi:hypothetical protein